MYTMCKSVGMIPVCFYQRMENDPMLNQNDGED